jgi:hypothetical protein
MIVGGGTHLVGQILPAILPIFDSPHTFICAFVQAGIFFIAVFAIYL